MPSVPKSAGEPIIEFFFNFGDLAGQDWGDLFQSLDFRAVLNQGYSVQVTLNDANFNLLKALIENDYFRIAREQPVAVKFRILSGSGGEFPETATQEQIAYLANMDSETDAVDMENPTFVAIDPASWFLNTGKAAGTCYTGRLSDVLKQVVTDYAPGVKLDVSETTDSKYGKWWMMRQDPKTFMASLLEWSTPLTRSKTQWIVGMDGMDMFVKEQASIPSQSRAFYRFWPQAAENTIYGSRLMANNALSIVQTKLITHGLSAVSGRYLDRTGDKQEEWSVVKDSNTAEKKIARTADDQSFGKPQDDPSATTPRIGMTSLDSIPEIYSAGELGLRYEDYLAGSARGVWLNMTNNLLRVRIRTLGHGEWSSSVGLGTDTVALQWTSAKGSQTENAEDRSWFMSGHWLVYGFHHRVRRGSWTTELYLARWDFDGAGVQVGS